MGIGLVNAGEIVNGLDESLRCQSFRPDQANDQPQRAQSINLRHDPSCVRIALSFLYKRSKSDR